MFNTSWITECMSTLQAEQAADSDGKPTPKRILATMGAGAAGALAVLVVLALLGLGARPAPTSAEPAVRPGHMSPADARRHRHSDALHAQHGTYVRDPYGCLYMFQYLVGSLSLAPVQNEAGQLICNR